MAPVFAHGRLRLYLLKLLEEAPRHGYEVIRLLEERFQGLYAPSAGTVYPRLAKLEAEGLVTHTTEGGRKVYSLQDEGRAELADRQGELTSLEREIRDALAALAAGMQAEGSAHALRHEAREQMKHARSCAARDETGRQRPEGEEEHGGESRRRFDGEKAKARYRAGREHDAHAEAAEHIGRIAREIQQQVRDQAFPGDWPRALQSGFVELTRRLGDLGAERAGGWSSHQPTAAESGADPQGGRARSPAGDSARELERLLDAFRDEIRDAARDHGVSEEQVREIRRRLSSATAHIGAVLRSPPGG